jgi:hypothetical protein
MRLGIHRPLAKARAPSPPNERAHRRRRPTNQAGTTSGRLDYLPDCRRSPGPYQVQAPSTDSVSVTTETQNALWSTDGIRLGYLDPVLNVRDAQQCQQSGSN